MRLHLGLALTALTFVGAVVPATAQAAVANCMSPDGSCEISNDPEDSLVCNCADGSGGGLVGGMAWAGLTEMELQPICEAELAAFCGVPMPPPGLMCGTPSGTCTISNDPIDFIDCTCADGSGFGMGGGNAWAGLSDPELIMICEGIVDTECMGGPPPPPPPPVGVNCTSRLGDCTVENDPEDYVACECADGSAVEGGGGMEWSGLTEGELLMVCEDQIIEQCGMEGGSTGGEGTGGSEGGSTGGEGTGGEGTAGEGSTGHGETGMDDSGTGGESGVGETGTGGGGSTGGSETEGGSEGSGGGGDEGGGGGGCSVAPRGATGSLALVLLGLLGLGRRRRAA